MKITGASSFPKVFRDGRRKEGLGLGFFWFFCKGMRVMKHMQGLLHFQKKPLSLLTIHTVAQQKFSAVGLPY